MSESNPLINPFETRTANSNQWLDLDDNTYNNHFTNGQCYMKVEFNRLDTTVNSIIRNLPIYPEDVTFNFATNYASSEILGRPGQISGYVSTNDITSQFNLHLHRELKCFDNSYLDENHIDELVALIQACQYPKRFLDGIVVPIVTYRFGDTQITGKQTNVTVKWSGPKIGNSYMECNVNISITHTPMGITYFNDIFGKQYDESNELEIGLTILTGYEGNPRQFK